MEKSGDKINEEEMEKKPESKEEVATVTFTKEDWYCLLRKCDEMNRLEVEKNLDSPRNRNSYTLCMCGEFVKWLPLCDDWRPHIKCLGRDNLVRFDGTRRDYLEKDDFLKTLWQWHATFQAVI